MKKLLTYLFMGIFAALQSCGIGLLEIELEEGEPRLVIEGGISNQAGPHVVRLSKSTSFSVNEDVVVENALVILSDNHKRADTLRYLGEGRYESMLSGIPDRYYRLDIEAEGIQYTAQAYMPDPAVIDSVIVRFYEEGTSREEGYYVSLHNLDSEETEGYYRWLLWVNDTLRQATELPGYFASVDLNHNNTPLILQYPDPFRQGDHLRIQTIKMDRASYQYYQALMELLLNDGGLLGPVPVNPANNISGEALGLFQATSITETELTIE